MTRLPDSIAQTVDGPAQIPPAQGPEAIVDRDRRDAIGRAIVDGYQRVPQDEDDLARSDAATSAMIVEEPW